MLCVYVGFLSVRSLGPVFVESVFSSLCCLVSVGLPKPILIHLVVEGFLLWPKARHQTAVFPLVS